MICAFSSCSAKTSFSVFHLSGLDSSTINRSLFLFAVNSPFDPLVSIRFPGPFCPLKPSLTLYSRFPLPSPFYANIWLELFGSNTLTMRLHLETVLSTDYIHSNLNNLLQKTSAVLFFSKETKYIIEFLAIPHLYRIIQSIK